MTNPQAVPNDSLPKYSNVSTGNIPPHAPKANPTNILHINNMDVDIITRENPRIRNGMAKIHWAKKNRMVRLK